MRQRLKTLALWLALIVVFVAVYELLREPEAARAALPTRSQVTFYRDLESESLLAVRPQADAIVVTKRDGTQYRANIEATKRIEALLVQHGVHEDEETSGPPEETAPRASSKGTEILVLGLVVLVAVIAVLVIAVRRASARAGTNLFSLRKSTARLVGERPATRFGDVGGARKAKAQLTDIVDFLKHPEKWQKSGARLPRGVLLEGPPGCGKTLLARALAGEAQASFFEVSATEFVELFVGVGAARVRDLFEEAAKKAPAIVFIDEIDAIGRRRGAGSVAMSHQEREQTLNQLLVSMDGFAKKSRVVVVAATNRADVLDPALLRPGRFDVRVAFGPLSAEERHEVLTIHARGKAVAPDLDLKALADRTADYTGAELEQLCNEVALGAARQGTPLALPDFVKAVDARSGQGARFDKLDLLLIESASQLSQPTGRVVVSVVLDDGTKVEGEVVWVDAAFAKIRALSGEGTLISKRRIREIAPGAGTESHRGPLVHDGWGARQPDVA